MLSEEEIFEGAKEFSNKLIEVFYKLTNIKVGIEFVDDLKVNNCWSTNNINSINISDTDK